jgi:hypothetical protein
MEIKNTRIYGLKESIIRSGCPMQIGEPMDFKYEYPHQFIPDEKDMIRARRLSRTQLTSGHDNFLKGIIVQFDLKYPQYFTPQLQRYHWIDIVSSQSKMHKLTSNKNIGKNCNKYVFPVTISTINNLIYIYNTSEFPIQLSTPGIIHIESKKEMFNYIISNLPMGYEMWMGISTNYLQLKTIYNQRKNHKLKDDWGYFCNWIESLPMSELIIGEKNEQKSQEANSER